MWCSNHRIIGSLWSGSEFCLGLSSFNRVDMNQISCYLLSMKNNRVYYLYPQKYPRIYIIIIRLPSANNIQILISGYYPEADRCLNTLQHIWYQLSAIHIPTSNTIIEKHISYFNQSEQLSYKMSSCSLWQSNNYKKPDTVLKVSISLSFYWFQTFSPWQIGSAKVRIFLGTLTP